jgi:2-polyprenyl-3-methyl-5-hydroxy-6-metoxy-1,4-benzoquinol methylase
LLEVFVSSIIIQHHLNPNLEAATRKLDFVKRSASWIAGLAADKENPRLLDLGCGPGIYAELFTQHGFQVTGVDLSPRSISYAKESAASNNLKIEYRLQNYLTIDYETEFDVVTLIYCDFGVLSPEDRSVLLKKIHRALKPGGLFIVDAWTPKYYENAPERKEWSYQEAGFWSPKPHACLEAFYRYDDCSTFVDQCVVIEEDSLECYNIWNHAFTSEEIQSDLAAAGFDRTDIYGDIAGTSYSEDSDTLCALARKS